MSSEKETKTNNFWGNIFSRDKDTGAMSTSDFLENIPVFKELSRRERKRVAAIIYDRTYEPGEFMFEKEQPGAAMFMIKKGQVKIVAPSKQGSEIELATISDGQFVGELALLDDSPRSASAKAAAPTQALAFFRTDLNKLLDTEPVIASKILRELAIIIGKRLKATNEQLYGKDV